MAVETKKLTVYRALNSTGSVTGWRTRRGDSSSSRQKVPMSTRSTMAGREGKSKLASISSHRCLLSSSSFFFSSYSSDEREKARMIVVVLLLGGSASNWLARRKTASCEQLEAYVFVQSSSRRSNLHSIPSPRTTATRRNSIVARTRLRRDLSRAHHLSRERGDVHAGHRLLPDRCLCCIMNGPENN